MGEPSSSWQNFNFRDDEGSAQGMQALRLLLAKLQEAQVNPRLKPSVNNLLMIEDLMLTSTQRLPSSVAPMHLEGGEGVPVMHGPMQANVVPHPLQGPLQIDGAKKKQYHGQERHVGKIREEGDFHDDDDEPPSRSRHKKRTNERRTKRSRRNSSGCSSSSFQSGRSSHGRFPKKGRHPRRKHHAWKRAKKLKKFKEGGKSITFQTFDGSYGHVDKVLTFIQQFDAAFGGEDFTEASKLRNVAMHLTKSARHWWSTLCAKNQAPKTWKVCRLTIMKQFLDDDAEDNVLTAWRSLKFKEGESLQNYIEKFWDTCLKATVYRNINFSEKRQQFCAGLPEDMRTYVQALRPKTIATVIHYTRVAYKIFKPKNPPNKGDKGKDKENGSSNVKSNNKKQASKRPYQGTNRLSPEEMERYRKENRCFRCGTTARQWDRAPYEAVELSTNEKLHIPDEVLAQIPAHIFIAKFKDEEGDNINTTIMPRETWTLHRRPEVASAIRAVHLEQFFRLPPWGTDYMRAHKLMSSIQYDGKAMLTDSDGAKVEVLITKDIINEALQFIPGAYDLIPKTKAIDNEKAFLKIDITTSASTKTTKVHRAISSHGGGDGPLRGEKEASPLRLRQVHSGKFN
ncbi:hypothetical protein L7F22_031747 [Adiantum nelumboides]|nr:hypothetical protein [Adiantum nelumboides]